MAKEYSNIRRSYYLPPELIEAFFEDLTGVKPTSKKAPARAGHEGSARVAGAIALLLAIDNADLNRLCERTAKHFTPAARKQLRKAAIGHIADLEIAEWVQSLPKAKRIKLRKEMT